MAPTFAAPRAQGDRRGEAAGTSRQKSPYSKSFFDLKTQPDGLLSLKRALDLDGVGLAIVNFAPGQGYTFTHSHECQEEIYICVQGKGQMQLDHEVLDMEPGDIIRVSPETRRSVYCLPSCSKIGYSMNSSPEHFVLYVVGAIPPASGYLIDDGIPHFEDVPSWFLGNESIVERNAMLQERYERIDAYKSRGGSGRSPGKGEAKRDSNQQRCISQLHRTKFLNNLTRAGEGGAAADPEAEGGGASEEEAVVEAKIVGETAAPAAAARTDIAVCAILVDAERKRVLVASSASGPWDLPGGTVRASEAPEEALSRALQEGLDIEAHPETFESFTFCSTRKDDSNALVLAYVCVDWVGEPRTTKAGEGVDWLSCTQLKRAEVRDSLGQMIPKLKPLLRQMAKKAM